MSALVTSGMLQAAHPATVSAPTPPSDASTAQPTVAQVALAVTPTTSGPSAQPTKAVQSQPTRATQASAPPTQLPAPVPTQAPTPQPTQPPPPTQPPAPTGVNGNPWGYDFNAKNGRFITNPPINFCDYFACIASFWNGVGYVEECQDQSYSLSGGIQGSCSRHGGNLRPLYAH